MISLIPLAMACETYGSFQEIPHLFQQLVLNFESTYWLFFIRISCCSKPLMTYEKYAKSSNWVNKSYVHLKKSEKIRIFLGYFFQFLLHKKIWIFLDIFVQKKNLKKNPKKIQIFLCSKNGKKISKKKSKTKNPKISIKITGFFFRFF